MRLTFSLAFFPCDPALLSVQQIYIFFHMMTSLQTPKAPGLQGDHGLRCTLSIFIFLQEGKSTFMVVKVFLKCVYVCKCVCGDLCSVRLRLLCLLHSNETPTLNRYIVDIRALTSSHPSFTTQRALRIALLPPAARHLTPNMCAAAVRELEWRGQSTCVPKPVARVQADHRLRLRLTS